MENNVKVKKNSPYRLFLGAIILFIIPIYLAVELAEADFWPITFFLSLLFLGVIVIVNIIISIILVNKNFDARKLFTEMYDKKNYYLKNYSRFRRHLFLLVLSSRIYLLMLSILIMLINASLLVFFGRIFMDNPYFVLGCLGLIWFYEVVALVVTTKKIDTEAPIGADFSDEEIPKIMEIAKEAAVKAGIKKRFKIKFTLGESIGIAKEKAFLVIIVGVSALKILNSKELQAVFIHEFAHAKKDTQIGRKIALSCNKWYFLASQPPFFPSFMFRVFSALINKHLSIFSTISSYKCEVEADEKIEGEDRQHAVNAFAKLEIKQAHNFWLPKDSYYSLEEAPKSILEYNKNCLVKAYQDNSEPWEKMIVKRIQPSLSSHPTLKERMENLRINKVNIDFFWEEEPFDLDVKKVADQLDEYLTSITDWENLRKKYYLRYQEIIDGYNASKDDKDLYLVALSYYFLCNFKKAEELFEQIVKEKNNKAALFYWGLLKCERNDDSGIEELFKAASNVNYMERVLSYIGIYLQYRGDLSLIERYKERYNSLLVDYLNSTITRFRKTKTYTIPFEEKEKLKEFILKLETIDGALLVSKKSRKQTLNILFYNFLDNEHIETEIDHARLESFVAEKCHSILLGGSLHTRDFLELGYKFKARLKNELLIKEINSPDKEIPYKAFVDDRAGRIREDEKRLWQGTTSPSFYSGIALAAITLFFGFLIGSVITYCTKSIGMGSIFVPLAFVGLMISLVKSVKRPRWIIVTENKLTYKAELYYWFEYNEIYAAKIFRTPLDLLMGTKSIVMKSLQTRASLSSRVVTDQSIAYNYFFHLHDAEGIISAIRQAMLNKKKLEPIKEELIEGEIITDEPKKIASFFKD